MHEPNDSAPARDVISSLRAWLAGKPYAVIMILAMVAAFCAYFSMYAFRRPFMAATYAGQTFAGGMIGLKTALILSQIFGYTLSLVDSCCARGGLVFQQSNKIFLPRKKRKHSIACEIANFYCNSSIDKT